MKVSSAFTFPENFSIVFGCLVAAVLLGRLIRRLLPDEHLAAESRDWIKLALGLVSTMAALVLGLLVSSAKGSYDTERSEVIQMAAKVAFLDRVLAVYGPDATEARTRFHKAVEEVVVAMLAQGSEWIGPPGSQRKSWQRSLCRRSGSFATRQLRSLLAAQSVPSISTPMLIILVSWLVVIFLGFSVLAPPNPTVVFALMVSALAVSGAIFLILELDQPFGGFLRISSEPMVNALHQFAQ